MSPILVLLVGLTTLQVGCNAQKLKLFTFGDSTIDIGGCFGYAQLDSTAQSDSANQSDSAIYYNWPRATNNLMWVDHIADMYEDKIEIQSCACGGSYASQDLTFYPDGSETPTVTVGLVSQIEMCPIDYDQNDNTVAVIMTGGNDILLSLLFPYLDPVKPFDFANAFVEAIRKLNDTGIDQIYIVNTIFENNPYVRQLSLNFPMLYPVLDSFQMTFFKALNDVIEDMQDQGFPIDSINYNETVTQIQAEAERSGVNGVDSCLDPSELPGETMLPECETLGDRVWLDGIHLADWGQKQLALIFAQMFESDGMFDDLLV
eukprot:TRINITY_DN6234_c0_g1_i8.p1 TRINITY_DN6234_c0_g1~~TRINITY_DN6234_c0_g1_i8.p1  ORF type:complete len:317 (+),score=25.15 TRINITY_DN6234_c0_g1_i8:26-976(+)